MKITHKVSQDHYRDITVLFIITWLWWSSNSEVLRYGPC